MRIRRKGCCFHVRQGRGRRLRRVRRRWIGAKPGRLGKMTSDGELEEPEGKAVK